MSIAELWPNRLLTLAEWMTWPKEARYRYELAEGVLRIGPHPPDDHQVILNELLRQLRDQLPPDLTPMHAAEVVVFEDFPATVRVPDVAVIPRAVLRQKPARLTARDVVLAIEVTAPDTHALDRFEKFNEYAEAGIENYWILGDQAMICAFELVGSQYELVTETLGTLSVTAPAPLTVDVQALFQ